MKPFLLVVTLSLVFVALLPGAASANSRHPFGSPDVSFNQLSKSSLDGWVSTVVLQRSGKILVGGDFAGPIQRFDASGRPDQAFNANAVRDRVPNTAVMLSEPNGSIILKGSPAHPLIRLNPDGTRDSSFRPSGVTSGVSALAREANGGLIIGHSKKPKGSTPYLLQRLTPAGTIDDAFAANATAALDGAVVSIAIQPNGDILVAGYFTGKLKRLHADGTPDITFSTNLGTPFNRSMNAITLQPDGKIIVVGTFAGLVKRVNADGTPDTAFNDAAEMAAIDDGDSDSANTAVVQKNGTILIGGDMMYDQVVAEFNADGTYNTAVNATLLGKLNRTVTGLAIQPNGKIIAVGEYTGHIKRFYGI
jgi:uncharacterized delta-60 repeat protein